MLVVAFVSFSLFTFVGDPINNMVGEETSDEERAELRETLGLTDPIHIQFSRFVVNASKGEFGISYQLRRPVSELISERLPATIELVLISALFALFSGTLLWGDLFNPYVLFLIFIVASFGLLGAYDDYRKIKFKNSSGVSFKFKIIVQILIAVIGILLLNYFSDHSELKNLHFPFFKNLIINLGWFFVPFSVFIIVGSSNAVNLTDGLDGLATVPIILVASCFAFISYVTGNIVFSEYLHIPYIKDVGEVAVFCGAIIGSCIGFLWFNAPPAKIFMGDTGSLSLGGSLGAVSVISKHEIVLAIIGGLFVLETASVIIQVISFKLTGKRVFMMAPLHHHFEKKGWPESTVVIRFWIISIILALIGLATLKLR